MDLGSEFVFVFFILLYFLLKGFNYINDWKFDMCVFIKI